MSKISEEAMRRSLIVDFLSQMKRDLDICVLSSGLTPKEREVLVLRFGLDNDGVIMTLEDIGKKLHFTRERARALEAQALSKMRGNEYFLETYEMCFQYIGHLSLVRAILHARSGQNG